MINFNFSIKGNVAIDYLYSNDDIELKPIIQDVIKNHGHKILDSQKMISKFEENFVTYINYMFDGHVLDYIVHDVNVECEIEIKRSLLVVMWVLNLQMTQQLRLKILKIYKIWIRNSKMFLVSQSMSIKS